MPELEYIVLTEWYNWIINRNECDVDLIGECQRSQEKGNVYMCNSRSATSIIADSIKSSVTFIMLLKFMCIPFPTLYSHLKSHRNLKKFPCNYQWFT